MQPEVLKMEKPDSVLLLVREQIERNLKQYMMVLILGGIWLIFTILTGGLFFTARNYTNLLQQTAYTAIAAMGVVLVIVAGHIDLSIGSVVGLAGAVAAYLQVYHGMPTFIAILAALLVGALIGAWQGYWISYRNIPAFIVTLAGMTLFRGILIYITQGQTISPIWDSFSAIGQGYLPKINNACRIHDSTLYLTVVVVFLYNILQVSFYLRKQRNLLITLPGALQFIKQLLVSIAIIFFSGFLILYRGIPYSIILVFFVALLYSFIATKTPFGRYVYAIGGNREAARYSGINIRKVNFSIFVSMGILASLSGVVFTARLSSAAASTGQGFELDVIASAIIGGANPLGGEGTIIGALLGALIMSSINNGMSLMNMSADIQMICKGLVLLIAVWFDLSTKNRK